MRWQIPTNGAVFTVLLGFLAALPALSIDINIPAILSISKDLSTTLPTAGLTITLFMVGFATGQFSAGPASDRWGRRPVLLLGLVFYTAAALGCAFSPSAPALVAWRLLQGTAAGASAVLAFTVIRDLFEGDEARAKRSYVAVVFSLAPMLAPTLGAWILGLLGWRPIFLTMLCGGLALLLAVGLGFAETKPSFAAQPAQAFHRAYLAVLSNRRFTLLAFVNALSYGAMFSYIAGSPVVLMGALHLSAQAYAAFFACTAASLTAGAWTSGRCAKAGIPAPTVLWIGLAGATLSALTMSLLISTSTRALVLLIPLLILNLFCRGLVSPTAQHLALDPMRSNAGTAAGALGVLQILFGALSSVLVATLLALVGPLGMTGTMAGLAALALAAWAWLELGTERDHAPAHPRNALEEAPNK